jgi:hypothetical protein
VPITTVQTPVIALVLSRLDYGSTVSVGLPAYLLRRLQSVLNASARLIFHLRRSDHITDALARLYWLCVSERIQYKIAVLVFKVLHRCAPLYIGSFTRVADHSGRRFLRSAHTNCLMVPPVKLSAQVSRAFPVAGHKIWNDLPADVMSAPSLSSFRQRLKAFLFRRSYPDLIF